MPSAEDPALRLAGRLRSLRTTSQTGKAIAQRQLAEALGVSVPLLSSWERRHDPVLPPEHRLAAYATFFATARSVERQPFRIIAQLTCDEQAVRDSLLAELTGLRESAERGIPIEVASPFADDLWRFPATQDITIVCAELPDRLLTQRPFTDPEDPDYAELYRYSDLDSLLELHGHIRALNPSSNVQVRSGASSLEPDRYTGHLVLLGGVDWNQVTAGVLHRADLPVRQQNRAEDSDVTGFEVAERGALTTFRPVLRNQGYRKVIVEDVAHFGRVSNPFNLKRTITICNGAHSRGVLGAVRALTDARFRDRNNAYVRSRFAGSDTFSILSRVQVLQGSVVTPDRTDPDHLLHEWPVRD
ncbi:hypothetical protein UK23_27130 [Lentzea aerocolonigenes]|uniref:Uncharacterized protein n=1 Tax=Lentzea aerocolonigenes TaxID=68170 RepID=A0A0F0GR91_LENAE|nr:hypothetical protein UK23_27130 [Lentzea aerocolonigenes]